MRARGLALLGAGLVLLSAAWLFATPPFQAPDEAAHYLRALTIAEGRLLGPRVGADAEGPGALVGDGWRAEEQRWILHDQRSVVVPAALAPPGQPCSDGRLDVGRRSCTEVTYTGDYYPIGYLLPAAAIAVSPDVSSAQWLSRAASLVPTLAFLVLALALVGRRSGWATIGLLAAMTPAVLFIGSVLNPSGLEIAANLASGVLRSSAGFTPLVSSLHAGVDQLGPTLREAVGGFGKLTSNLPLALPVLWGLAVLVMLCAALVRGDRDLPIRSLVDQRRPLVRHLRRRTGPRPRDLDTSARMVALASTGRDRNARLADGGSRAPARAASRTNDR